MSEFKNGNTDDKQQTKPKRNRPNLLLIALFCIFVVLVLANFDAILKPINALNAILSPIFIGLVIAYVCNPILRFCEIKIFYKIKRRRVNRALSMLLTYVFVLLLIAGLVWLVVPNVLDSINDLRFNGFTYITTLIDSLNAFIDQLPFDLPNKNGEALITLEKVLNYAMKLFSDYGSAIAGGLGGIFGSVITVLKNILVGVFVSIYVLLSKDRLNAGCRRVAHALLSNHNEEKFLYYTGQANKKFGGFLVGKMVDSMMVGITCAILFSIFKIPYPILIAVIIGITDFIPFFGPFIGAIPSALIIFIVSPSKALLFVLLILVVQQIDGNLIAPIILGDHTGLTSLGVLIAITLMGGLFGFVGMLIGVPLFAVIMTMLDDFIKYKLHKKGSPTDLYSYYPADAFIRPSDEAEEHMTLTQKFMLWVSSVEDELEALPKGKKQKLTWGIKFRRACLRFAKFMRRLFSIKPIPEDQSGSVFATTRKNGMPANRSLFRTVILSIVTIFIYPLHQIELIAQNTNIACKRDGKRTLGFFSVLFFSILTLGIYYVIWHCNVIKRYTEYCERNGETCVTSSKHYALWCVLGAPILIGPFLANAKFLAAFNQVATIFNRTHTFPISDEVLAEEAAEGAAVHAARKNARIAMQDVFVGTMPQIDEAPVVTSTSDILDTLTTDETTE